MSELTEPAATYREDTPVEAEFTLESPAVCPACRETISAVHILRLLRTRVNFVSTLPRRGQVFVCSKCKTILSGSLGGIV